MILSSKYFRGHGVIFVLLASYQSHASDPHLYTEAEVFGLSDSTPIYQLTHDLEGPKPSAGDSAFTHNQISMGINFGRFDAEIISRYDYWLHYSEDTIELIHAIENDLPIDEGRQYDIRLEANHLRASGLKLSYNWKISDTLDIEMASAVYRANQTTSGELSGQLSERDDKVQGRLALDYFYTEDKLLDRPQQDFSGYGATLDLHARYRYNENISLSVNSQDLLNRFYWQDATFTEARSDSENIARDENGKLDVKPLLSGFEGLEDKQQRLPSRTSFSADVQLSEMYKINGTYHAYGDTQWPEYTLSKKISGNNVLLLGAIPEYDAFSVGFSNSLMHIYLTADSLDYRKAGIFQLNIRLGSPWES